MENLLHVGKNVPRTAEIDKVTGHAVYIDEYKRPGMLHGKILRSPHPHARIMGIDTHRAEELPGVKIVLTGKDTLGVKNGIWRSYRDLCDEEILCREKVRYVGDAVATLGGCSREEVLPFSTGVIGVPVGELARRHVEVDGVSHLKVNALAHRGRLSGVEEPSNLSIDATIGGFVQVAADREQGLALERERA